MRWLHYTRTPLCPRFYYGWVMAGIAMLGVMCSAPAQTYGVSVFLPFIRGDLGLTPAQTASAYMLGTLLASLPLTWIGSLLDRYGPRRTMTVIIICFCLSCLLISRVRGLFSLFGAFFLLRLFGQASLTMMSSNTLAYWFHRHLGLVNGFKSVGVALVIASAPAFHLFLIRQTDWRTAYVLLAALMALVLLPLMLFVYRNRPEEVGQSMEQGVRIGFAAHPAHEDVPIEWAFKDALRTRAFWIMAIAVSMWALIGTAVAFSSASIFEDRGLDSVEAAYRVSRMFTAMGLTLAGAYVVAGWLVDHWPPHRIMSVTAVLMSSVVFLLAQPGSENWAWAVGVAMGLTQSLNNAVAATVWVRYFGRNALGRIRGFTFTLLVAASSVGPLLIDGTAAWIGSYTQALLIAALLPAPLIIAAFYADRPRPGA